MQKHSVYFSVTSVGNFQQLGNILLAALVHGGLNTPLLGPNADLLPLILFVLALELVLLARCRREKKAKVAG